MYGVKMNIKILARVLFKFTLDKFLPNILYAGMVKKYIPAPKSYFLTRFNKERYYIHNKRDLGEYIVHDGTYWVEEHRTPCEGKSNNIALTESEIIALNNATMRNKKLYRKEDGKYIGNTHYDLRIQVKKKITSFVVEDVPNNTHIKPLLAILQPEHYKKDPYVIRKGYGKGVKKDNISGRCIMYIGNNHIHVGLEGCKRMYAFVPFDNSTNAYIMQVLKPKHIHNHGKTHMKFLLFGRDNEKIEKLICDDNYVCSAKKDGTRINITHIHNKSDGYTYVNIGSYKPDKNMWKMYYKDKGIKLEDAPRIQYNVKLGLFRIYDPYNKLGGLDISGELWVKANTGTDPRVSKIVQGSDYTSRRNKYTYYIYPHTIHNNMSPAEQWNLLMQLRDITGGIYKQLPHGYTEKGKRSLIKKCKIETAVDGVVFFNMITGESIKAKWVEDTRDGIIVGKQDIVDKYGQRRNLSIPLVKINNNVTIPMSGKLTEKEKSNIFYNTNDYIGATAKYRCTSITKNGVPFQPVLESIEF